MSHKSVSGEHNASRQDGKRFPEPVPPVQDFLVNVLVRLEPPIQRGGEGPLIGYFQAFGIRCQMGEVRNIISASIHDGDVVWNESEVSAVSINDLDPNLKNVIALDSQSAIWFTSGRALFSENA